MVELPLSLSAQAPSDAPTGGRFQGLALEHGDIAVEPLSDRSFAGIDLALFSAGSGVARDFAPEAVSRGVIVIDNS
jgi:aspartate-semialdehyde dehydrogenase